MNQPAHRVHTTEWPRVTIAIPLYRSERYLDVIINNIQTVDYPNLEYIISDRHTSNQNTSNQNTSDRHTSDRHTSDRQSGDAALARLQQHFVADKRIRWVAATDAIGWVDHYNALLTAATGEYMMWMPHDDSFPASYITRLVTALENDPQAILAFGDLVPVNPPINQAARPRPLNPMHDPWESCVDPGQPWTFRTALRLFYRWNLGIAMRGVFRVARIRDAGLYLRHTPQDEWADTCWLFAVALLGPMRYVPCVHSYKRYHPQSAHAQWAMATPGQERRKRWGRFGVLLGYALRYTRPRRAFWHVAAALLLRYLRRIPKRTALLARLIG